MDLSAPALPRVSEPRSGWRTAALVAGGVAVIELVALLVVALAFIAKPFAGEAAATEASRAKIETQVAPHAKREVKAATTGARTGAKSKKAPAAAELPRTKTTVLVLNGNGVLGAASAKASVVRRFHYPVLGVGDAARRGFPLTIVMYRNGFRGEGVRLATDLGLGARRAVPLDGMGPRDLHGAKLAVIVGAA